MRLNTLSPKWGLLAFGLLLIVAVIALPRRSPRSKGPIPALQQKLPPPDEGSGVAMKGVAAIVIRDEKDRKVWEFQAEQIEVSDDRSVTRVQNLSKGTYYRDNEPLTTFKADNVVYNSTTKHLEISGNVEASDVRGLSVSAARVRWEPKERKFICYGSVQGSVKDVRFTTKNVQLFPDSERAVCPNPVIAHGKNFELRGPRLSADLKNDTIEMPNVIAFVQIRRPRRGVPEGVPPVDPSFFRRRA